MKLIKNPPGKIYDSYRLFNLSVINKKETQNKCDYYRIPIKISEIIIDYVKKNEM